MKRVYSILLTLGLVLISGYSTASINKLFIGIRKGDMQYAIGVRILNSDKILWTIDSPLSAFTYNTPPSLNSSKNDLTIIRRWNTLGKIDHFIERKQMPKAIRNSCYILNSDLSFEEKKNYTTWFRANLDNPELITMMTAWLKKVDTISQTKP